MKTTEWFKKRDLLFGYFISILAILPSLVWIALDTTAWGGDQSQYGRATLELFYALRHSPTDWFSRMLDAFPSKPNGLIWIGQFFVPLGYLIGSIDTALLFSITVMQALTLILIYRSIWELSNRTLLAISAIGCLVVASAPLFIGFATYYLVETMQTLCVAWFVLISSLAPRWNRTLILGQLSAATAFALLAKEIQPLFCLWPGLVALSYVFRTRENQRSEGALRNTTLLTLVLGIPLIVATLAWYYRNLETVAHHLYTGAYGPGVRVFWGKEDTYLNTLAYWLSTTKSVFFLSGIWGWGLLLVASGVICHFVRSNRPMKHFTVCSAAAALQIVTVLSVFSLSPTRQPRYLLPVLPYFALLLSWSVAQINRLAIVGLTVALFAVQLAMLQGQALNIMPPLSPWLRPFERDAKNSRVLKSIVAKTCIKTNSQPYLNILAIDPSLQGDWLAPEPANYIAAKNSLVQNNLPPCYYGYLGVDFFGSTVTHAWNNMLSNQVHYFITVDPKVYPVPAQVFNETLNQHNFPVVLEKVQTSGLFEAERPLGEDPGILIFRRIDYVAQGRLLSDQGQHEQAIAILRKATALEPTNVEAWANLTLAYSRQGWFEEGIVAGLRGLGLNPDHYWLNLISAQMYYERKQWSEVIALGHRALVGAPNAQERARTLALMGWSYYRLNKTNDACRMFIQANAIQPAQEILPEIKNLGCPPS